VVRLRSSVRRGGPPPVAAGGGDCGGRLGRPRGGGVGDPVGATAGVRCGSGGSESSAGGEARAPAPDGDGRLAARAPVVARLEREIEMREWVLCASNCVEVKV